MTISNKLSYDEIINILGYKELPLEYKAAYRGFVTYLSKQKNDFIDNDDLKEINDIIHLDNDTYNDLKEKLESFNQNKDLVIASYFFKYILYIAVHPGANSLYENPNCTLFDNLYFKAFMFICIVQESYQENIRRGIPKQYWERRYLDVKRFVEHLVVKKKDMAFRFSTFTPYAQMYNIGYFSYMPYFYQATNTAFINGKNEIIFLAGENHVIRKDGQFDGVNHISDPDFTTTFEENETSFIGYLMDPVGTIINKKIVLDKKEWKKHLSYGDMIIEFHVHDHYNLENFYKSNLEAYDFFKKYFPDMYFRAFYGYSWLFSPQMNYLVDSTTSNIAKIKSTGYITPNRSGESLAFRFIFDSEHIEVDEIPETSSLLRNLKAYMKKGFHINCGSYYLFTCDLDKYYNNKYLSYFKKSIK